MIDFLEAADERRTATKSSISQAKNTKLSVTNDVGVFLPISFDHIDYIRCGEVKSHRATVALTDEEDYKYTVKTCTYVSDLYVYKDTAEERIEPLPEWFGAGFYRKYVESKSFVNGDETSLGTRNKTTIQSGLHYVEAKDLI